MDVHTPAQRSFNMSRIRGKNTKPEILIRKWLWENGYRYRLHKKDIPGKPDIAFSGKRKVIFIHGCFWHKHDCIYFKWPESNAEFWKEKISSNIKRDSINCKMLNETGWHYFIGWECEINHNLNNLQKSIVKFLVTN